ncbi:MAG: lipid A biosynthesis acyltransferase [Persephonella sp.]|nr:MAG: lipid A biosynthesis acyltransferase [Persephonella sp.]RUM61125.1 MAG: lipid A biosynthesis acyltransferase [Persephonella sp.]
MLTLLLRGGVKLLQISDRDKALRKGELLGSLLNFIGYRKKVILKNLDIAFPELNKLEKEKTAEGVLQYIGRNIVDFVRIPVYSRKNQILDIADIVEGKELLYKYKDKGAILITGHIGNWEILGAVISKLNYKITVLAYRQENKKINQFIESIRTSANIGIIYHDQPLKKMLKILNEGGFLGFLADQNALRHRGVFVDFFNFPASTISLPAKISLKYRIPMIFTYNYLDLKDKKYKIFFKEIDISKYSKNQYKELTQEFTKELEKAIRKNPSQYLWTHKRWKTRPEGEPENIYR